MSNANSLELLNQRRPSATTDENEKQESEILGIQDNEFGLIIIGTVFGMIGLAVFGYIYEQAKKKCSDNNACVQFKRWWESLLVSNKMSMVKTLIMFMISPMSLMILVNHPLLFTKRKPQIQIRMTMKVFMKCIIIKTLHPAKPCTFKLQYQ